MVSFFHHFATHSSTPKEKGRRAAFTTGVALRPEALWYSREMGLQPQAKLGMIYYAQDGPCFHSNEQLLEKTLPLIKVNSPKWKNMKTISNSNYVFVRGIKKKEEKKKDQALAQSLEHLSIEQSLF